MLAIAKDQGDYVGSLIVDQLIKGIMIKLDSVFQVKDEI